jgi:hypothetical protein
MTVTDHISERGVTAETPRWRRPAFIDDDDSRTALRELLDEAGIGPADLRSRDASDDDGDR